MNEFLLAVQFLTIIPVKVKRYQQKYMGRALIYFPLVGLLLGVVLSFCAVILTRLALAPLSVVIALTALLAVLTGGMHLDGLADTVDAFSGGRNKEERLRIMRDPHIGALGALSMILLVLLKIAFLYSLSGSLVRSLILSCVLSRWSLVMLVYLFAYAREEGKAKSFTQAVNERIFLTSTAVALAVSLFIWQLPGFVVFVFTGACAYIFGSFVNKKIGGITGDTLGAAAETAEVITLFGLLFMKGVFNA
jgi:adenosylcobinamide-GDP ribazoletransferase